MNLGKEVKVSTAITPAAGVAGTADINGTILDMQNYEGVLMMCRLGVITANAATSVKAQQGAESNLSDAADLEATGITVADDDDNQLFVIDLYRPTERYVRLVVDRATENAVVAEAHYVQYGPRKRPVTNTVADLVTYELHVSPDEGTA